MQHISEIFNIHGMAKTGLSVQALQSIKREMTIDLKSEFQYRGKKPDLRYH